VFLFVIDGVEGQRFSVGSMGEFPDAFEVSRLEQDELLRKRANSLVGAVALNQMIDVDSVDETIIGSIDTSNNLAESIVLASEGDPKAIELVKMNVKTDYFERACKSGFVMSVELDKNEDGQLAQNGQTLQSVQVNSLKYLTNDNLKDRAKVETLHSMRDQLYTDTGVYKKYARVTLSLVDDRMSDDEADKAGFFVPTRSLAIQFVTENEDGVVTIESAFVAGKQAPNAEPFDVQSARKFAEKLGVDYEGLGSEDIHARPILVSKTILPDVLAGAQLFDESASEVTGETKFFGKNSDSAPTREDYIQRYTENKQMIAGISSSVDSVANELIKLLPDSPTEATSELARLNDKQLKDRIVLDENIDANVLGVNTAHEVNHARHLHKKLESIPAVEQQQRQVILNEIDKLQHQINIKGSSSSCAGGASSKKSDTIATGPDRLESDADQEDTVEDCDFISKECPNCGKKDVETKCRDGKYYGECGCVSD
jgi:hypothetical protein